MDKLSIEGGVVNYNDLSDMSPIFEGREWLANWAMRALSIDKVNDLHSRNCDVTGVAFVERLLTDLDITLKVVNESRLDKLPSSGRFVTVSNHPFGALDGIILIKLLGERFPEFKVMVNMVLNYIRAMRGNFIAVDPFSSDISEKRMVTMRGIRGVISNLREGNPVGFFPSGAVSKLHPNLRVEDRVWQPSIIRLIQQLDVPVVPIHFYGGNSIWFNLLGVVHWRLRSLLLPSEVFNKRGTQVQVAIGEPITVKQMRCYTSIEELGDFLRNRTYST
ncbi:MAG: 1-acyl-sn-glycerol-3-phosphate acyltransferase [Bacteroidales bacterium]